MKKQLLSACLSITFLFTQCDWSTLGFTTSQKSTVTQQQTKNVSPFKEIKKNKDLKLIFDISDYNWGTNEEYSSIEEFQAFTQNAISKCPRFGGYYVEVLQGTEQTKHWKEVCLALEEMHIPYGLYGYSRATTQEQALEELNALHKALRTVKLDYNVFPFMLDLEFKQNNKIVDQNNVLHIYNKFYKKDFITYASAGIINQFNYDKNSKQIWVAHYNKTNQDLPNYNYDEVDTYGINNIKAWQFTSRGHKLFNTNHLDISVVNNDWFEKYYSLIH